MYRLYRKSNTSISNSTLFKNAIIIIYIHIVSHSDISMFRVGFVDEF